MKPVLIDLFCGAGGASMGYSRAGFDVIGVDMSPQPNYPFQFIQASWDEPLSYLPGMLEREGRTYVIHASPPCQRYSAMTHVSGNRDDHPDLVDPVRQRLIEIGAPFIIENVPGAPLHDPTLLCGSMFFGRQVRRHRLFETYRLELEAPRPCNHRAQGRVIGVYGHPGGSSRKSGQQFGSTYDWSRAMGIEWMTGKEMAQAIPPDYTEWIGNFVKEQL